VREIRMALTSSHIVDAPRRASVAATDIQGMSQPSDS
jgi:hypothetical protein